MDNYNKKRILIVDDDEEIRELLEFDIAQSGPYPFRRYDA